MSEKAKYSITGLVDQVGEDGAVNGQYEIGSVQELSVEEGSRCVDAGTCELFIGDDETNDLDATGETGEGGGTGEDGGEDL